MDLLDLIVCTECKTRVEYHDGPDGYMSCECWVRTHQDEPMPEKWIEIADLKINQCGICGQDINERLVFRCADCGLPFHQVCLDQHCKHGNQKQELRSENLFLKQQVKNLEEYMLKGVAFRDELQTQLCRAADIKALTQIIAHDGACENLAKEVSRYIFGPSDGSIQGVRSALEAVLCWSAELRKAHKERHLLTKGAQSNVTTREEIERLTSNTDRIEIAEKHLDAALSSSAPCSHAEELARYREAVEWALHPDNDIRRDHRYHEMLDELRRRAGGEG